jgi:putative PEP-CTERM system TPR-repeat lipoprotein
MKRLASAQVAANDVPGATASLKKALALNPNDVEALAGLGRLEADAGRYADAITIAQQIQTRAPNEPIGFLLEGDMRIAQKQFLQAVIVYERAFAIRPTSGSAIKVHAAQSMAGNATQADAKLVAWMNNHPDDFAVPLYWAEELAKRGKTKQAIEQYLSVLDKDPRNVVALNNLANIYQQESDPRALNVAEEAFKLSPESPAIVDTLGWILVGQGQTTRGLELLQKAAGKAPNNAEIQYHLAVALAKAGDKASARRQLENLLARTTPFPQREAAQTLLKQL